MNVPQVLQESQSLQSVYGQIVLQALNVSKKEVRLLELNPGPPEDEITCTTYNSSLPRKLYYETISYCWGDSAQLVPITLNKQSVCIPANAANALKQVRRVDEHRLLWIDVLCINQQDLVERAQQVCLMREIYSQSAKNLICLHASSESSPELALQSIHDVLAEARSATDEWRNLRDVAFGTGNRCISTSTPFQGTIHWRPLESLIANPWFSRVWIMQEVALAPSNICYYGTQTILLTELLRSFVWIGHKSSTMASPVPPAALGLWSGLALWEFVDPQHGKYRDASGKPTTTVLAALEHAKYICASEPRDRIFGLLGLMGVSWSSDVLPVELQPDYSRSMMELCRDVTKFALCSDAGTRIALPEIRHRSEAESEDDAWPSWTPRWYRRWDAAVDDNEFGDFFSADALRGQPIDLLQLPQSPDTLLRRGIILSEISQCSEIFTISTSMDFQATQSWLREVEVLAGNKKSSPWTDNGVLSQFLAYCGIRKCKNFRLQVLADVLLAGMNLEHKPATHADIAAYTDFAFYIFQRNMFPRRERYIEPVSRNASASRFQSAFKYACQNRRVFVTRNGHLGLGPRMMKVGDCVAVVYGSGVPYMLRPHNGCFRVVGQCYVDGIMYGESLRSRISEQTLVLQ